jgi:hypothetical protein
MSASATVPRTTRSSVVDNASGEVLAWVGSSGDLAKKSVAPTKRDFDHEVKRRVR